MGMAQPKHTKPVDPRLGWEGFSKADRHNISNMLKSVDPRYQDQVIGIFKKAMTHANKGESPQIWLETFLQGLEERLGSKHELIQTYLDTLDNLTGYDGAETDEFVKMSSFALPPLMKRGDAFVGKVLTDLKTLSEKNPKTANRFIIYAEALLSYSYGQFYDALLNAATGLEGKTPAMFVEKSADLLDTCEERFKRTEHRIDTLEQANSVISSTIAGYTSFVKALQMVNVKDDEFTSWFTWEAPNILRELPNGKDTEPEEFLAKAVRNDEEAQLVQTVLKDKGYPARTIKREEYRTPKEAQKMSLEQFKQELQPMYLDDLDSVTEEDRGAVIEAFRKIAEKDKRCLEHLARHSSKILQAGGREKYQKVIEDLLPFAQEQWTAQGFIFNAADILGLEGGIHYPSFIQEFNDLHTRYPQLCNEFSGAFYDLFQPRMRPYFEQVKRIALKLPETTDLKEMIFSQLSGTFTQISNEDTARIPTLLDTLETFIDKKPAIALTFMYTTPKLAKCDPAQYELFIHDIERLADVSTATASALLNASHDLFGEGAYYHHCVEGIYQVCKKDKRKSQILATHSPSIAHLGEDACKAFRDLLPVMEQIDDLDKRGSKELLGNALSVNRGVLGIDDYRRLHEGNNHLTAVASYLLMEKGGKYFPDFVKASQRLLEHGQWKMLLSRTNPIDDLVKRLDAYPEHSPDLFLIELIHEPDEAHAVKGMIDKNRNREAYGNRIRRFYG